MASEFTPKQLDLKVMINKIVNETLAKYPGFAIATPSLLAPTASPALPFSHLLLCKLRSM